MSASSSITNNGKKNHQTTVKQDRGGFYNIILNPTHWLISVIWLP